MTGSSGNRFSRRFVLGALLASAAAPRGWAEAPLQSPRPLARPAGFAPTTIPSARALIEKANLGGQISYVVASAQTGRILESSSPLLRLPTASVAKAMTAEYALETLGPAHAFHTRLIATAPLINGRIDGDLALVGGGDPVLNTDALAEMATALKSTGLREVTGRFLVHNGPLPHFHQIDPGQPDHLGYNPAISGLNLNFNRVHFEWKRAQEDWAITMDARTLKYRPEVGMARMQIVDRAGPVYTYANGGAVEKWTVARPHLGNGGSRWLPVRNPEVYAGEVFQTFARSHGIVLPAPALAEALPKGTVLVDRRSPPLQRILQAMLQYSTNLTAEISGLSASIARGREVTDLASSADEMNTWLRARAGLRHPGFVDHSGLGDATRISAGDMTTALLRFGPDSTLASILHSLRISDADGKLLPIKVKAKTGTLNFVSGLAGFIETGPDKDLVFAIFTADMDRRANIPIADRERPFGAKGWASRARRLQKDLIARWHFLYGGI